MKKVRVIAAALAMSIAALVASCSSEISVQEDSNGSVNQSSANYRSASSTESPKRVTGYFCEWGIYGAHGNYFPQNVPYDKLTHINYAFVGLNPADQSVEIYDSWATSEIVSDGEKWDSQYKGCLGLLRKYKAKYPHVKVLISVGGWTKSHGFHAAAASEQSRKRAADNLVRFVTANNLDGVDIDWEYPGVHRDKDPNDEFDKGAPGSIEDKENYTLFLKTIREALDAQGAKDGKYYELTAAIGVGYDKIAVTNPGEYSRYLDALNLMSYDMHGAFEPTTGHQAPLYSSPYDNNPNAQIREKYNIDWAVKEFIRQGVPSEKIVLGIPFYSRGWNDVSGGHDFDGNGTPDGMFGNGGSSLSGTWGVGGQSPYYEIKVLENQAGWEKFRDPYSKACWLYNRSAKALYTYDDAEAIRTKMNYIKENNLGGAMYWELDGDDWKNGYDLVNIIADSMLEGVVFDDDTTPVTPADPENPETPSDGNDKEPVTEIPDGGKATGVPAAPSIEQTKWNGESSFSIRMNIWWGQNGTLAELIENGKTVESVILTDNSPSAQSYTFNVTGKANGTYEYQVKISNKFGSTLSNTVKYTVTQGSSSQEPGNTEPETPGNDSPSEEEPYIPPVIGGGTIEVEGLPTYVLTGYWQNFNNGAKVLRITDVPLAYNIICVAFGESTGTPGEVVFNLDTSLGFSKAQFIADIAAAKARGQHVILSVGGETGNVLINSDAAASRFASSITSLMNEYGFEGVDIDLEHGINAEYISKALRAIPKGSIITMAPQTIDMQTTGMEYFKLALAISDILTINNMQYYNSGSMLGEDGNVYVQGNENFLTALAAIQLEHGLRPDQVGLGLPASTRGAGSGYVDPQMIINALDTLIHGTRHGSYMPPHTYPGLRGVMTWSINWDASNGYNFANKIGAYLAQLNNTDPVTPEKPETDNPGTTNPRTDNPGTTNPGSDNPGTTNPGTDKPQTPSYPEWSAANVHYNKGDLVIYNGAVYECDYEHSSNSAWVPGTAGLWFWKLRSDLDGSNPSHEQPSEQPQTPSEPETPSYPEIPEGPVNTQLPARIMSGYWHNWDGGTPFIKLRNVDSSWDVINIAFAEPVTPGSGNGNMKFSVASKDGYSLTEFKSDVKLLHSKGKKIVLSIGGYEGYFYLADEAAVSNFVRQINALVDEYEFDGIDIDLEQSSVQLNSGADPDFRNVQTPRIKNMISAIRQICDAHGDDFILSWAPETFYMQLGHQYYGGANGYVDSRAGAYLAMVYALRDKTTYVQTQLYNSAPIVGRDGQYYNMGTVEGIVEMCNMLLEGFSVNNNSAYMFPALRPDQVVIAVPCSSGAAGSGQISNAGLQEAFRKINAKHPGLRGIMTWSINWDSFQNQNSFARENKAFLNSL